MLDPDDPVVRSATFGRIVEDFLNSPVGDYLRQKAESEEKDAMEQLKTVDADNPSLVRKYQNQALVASKIIEWLGDAVLNGQICLDKLKEDIDGE